MSEDIGNVAGKEVVFETENMSLSQNDLSDRYLLSIFRDEIELRPCELIAFRRKINAIDLMKIFDENHPETEILSLPSCDRFFVFSIREILELRDLFHGAFAMLELNSLIQRQLRRLPI